MHPSNDIRGSKSKRLSEKRIILGVTGSIAAVETIKLAREIIRHDAEVIPVMTLSATKIIHPDALWFATGNKPITELTGETEHVKYCGRVKTPVDLLLICPCTANTISKIAHGIDDTSVTTFATTAVGTGLPVLIVPSMHLSMYDHKIVQQNIKKCKDAGIKFIDPFIEKNKAKMPNIEEILANVFRETNKKDLKNKKILIIGGPTAEPVDNVRIITNRSSGKTAVSMAKNAFYRGADVEILYGYGKESVPDYIKNFDFESIKDIQKFIKNKDLKKYDMIIVCAALSDYIPKKQRGKIPSGKNKLLIEMSSAPKIISQIRKKAPKTKIIGFKVEEKTTKLKEKAYNLLKTNNLDFVVANTISGFSKNSNDIWIIDENKKCVHKKGKKEIITNFILDTVK